MNVIFDMDGVIFDTERFYLDCCIPAAEKVGLENIEEVSYRCIGLTPEETEKQLIAFYGEDAPLQQFHDETFRIFRERYDREGLPVKPGVREILEWLKGQGAKTVLASSTGTDIVRMELTDANLIGFFDHVIGGDTVDRSKPAPDIFLKAAELIGEDPEDCFVIEDSHNGIRAAFAAGMRPIMVPDLLSANEEMRGLAVAVLPTLVEAQEYLEQVPNKITG